MLSARTFAPPLPRRWHLLVTTLIAVPCVALALAIGGAASASAAGPATIGPGTNVLFPSWFWGATTVCATNTGSASGTVTVDPWPWGDGFDTIAVPASGRGCTSGWWWANILQVTNRGSTPMVVESR